MAVVIVRVTGLAVRGEIEKSIGTSAGEVAALLEARIDDRDANLVAIVLRVREAERADEDVLELGVSVFSAALDCAVGADDGVDRNGSTSGSFSRASKSSPCTRAVSDSSSGDSLGFDRRVWRDVPRG